MNSTNKLPNRIHSISAKEYEHTHTRKINKAGHSTVKFHTQLLFSIQFILCAMKRNVIAKKTPRYERQRAIFRILKSPVLSPNSLQNYSKVLTCIYTPQTPSSNESISDPTVKTFHAETTPKNVKL